MRWHCGLLDERPDQSRVLARIKRGNWNSLGPDVWHELMVWLAMPGFSIAFHQHTLGVSREVVTAAIPAFEDWREDVIDNWISATREDCVRLCRMRPDKGDVPIIFQLRIMDDVKAGISQVDLAGEYGLDKGTINGWKQRGLRSRGELPSGFELLTR